MSYDFSELKKRAVDIADWLHKEYSAIRTGRATPVLLDTVTIDSYGTQSPIKHVSAISVEDARTIRITPWDKSHIRLIESAIAASNLGVSTSPDGESIRVAFPVLTSERRVILQKLAKEKLEEARVSLRSEREKILNDITAKEKAKEISEDEKFRLKAEVQKQIDAATAELERIAEKKEAEIND